jgi:hypothetical protein
MTLGAAAAGILFAASALGGLMPKKLAVGARKAGMKGKQSATKRELIDAGEDKVTVRRSPDQRKNAKSIGRQESSTHAVVETADKRSTR